MGLFTALRQGLCSTSADRIGSSNPGSSSTQYTDQDVNRMSRQSGTTVTKSNNSVVVTWKTAHRTSTQRFDRNPNGTWHAAGH